jgi:hypothetical protein
MNSGYKGSRVGVTKATIENTSLTYEIQFVDEDGVVHGIMRHGVPLDNESEISLKANELLDILRKRAEGMHFASPTDGALPSAIGGPRGIGESLGNTGQTSDEPDGTQG